MRITCKIDEGCGVVGDGVTGVFIVFIRRVSPIVSEPPDFKTGEGGKLVLSPGCCA